MQIAKMNLRPGRGRSIKALTILALQTLRSERNGKWHPYAVESTDPDEYEPLGLFSSLRQARFCQLRAMHLQGVECIVTDWQTGLRIF